MLIKDVPMVDTLSMTAGDMVEITTGEADVGASGSTTLAGVCAETVDNADDGEVMDIIDGHGAVFSIEDANARIMGATLDIDATYDGVTTSSNTDLVCVRPSSDTERTFLKIIQTSLYDDAL